jgi:hypothetical protein
LARGWGREVGSAGDHAGQSRQQGAGRRRGVVRQWEAPRGQGTSFPVQNYDSRYDSAHPLQPPSIVAHLRPGLLFGDVRREILHTRCRAGQGLLATIERFVRVGGPWPPGPRNPEEHSRRAVMADRAYGPSSSTPARFAEPVLDIFPQIVGIREDSGQIAAQCRS